VFFGIGMRLETMELALRLANRIGLLQLYVNIANLTFRTHMFNSRK